MATYYPVTVCRSDGLLEVATNHGMELNQPTPSQMNDKPDEKGNVNYYRRLSESDAKAVDWRRKIGGMLMNILGGRAHAGASFRNLFTWASADLNKDRNYILTELPDGYVLWEHIKYNKNKGLDVKKKEKGKHAAGMYDRQDAYLYGHPQGRKKRYRSPADFFPHLLWLGTDKEGDSANCSCKICSPDGDDDTVDESITLRAEEIQTKKEPKLLPSSSTITPRFIVSTTQSISNQISSASPTKATIHLPPKKMSEEQKADYQPTPINKFIYRPGELVWFNNGSNWRLGVVSKRSFKINFPPRYLIQPLSNPEQYQELRIKEQDALRPWLAWSVPETTNPDLKNMHYDAVPWDRVVRGEFDNGRTPDYVVDSSILAAKNIDASYSLFDRIENAVVGNGDIAYNGMFLGAEKIWAGEPVRLSGYGSDIVILIIDRMIERTGNPPNVLFTGDEYKLVEMPSHSRTSDWPKYSHNLPPRMITDIAFRNEVAARKGIWYEWRLTATPATKTLKDVKGRWYETQTLLPILKTPPKYQADLLLGLTSDAGEWMNGRKDNNNFPDQRQKNRRSTLGRSVPDDFKVSRGLDGAPEDDVFPDEQTLIPSLATEFENIDHFMDLDQALYGTET